MIAQCTSCQQTFTTDAWGVQACPHCGTQVYLEDPSGASATPPPAAVPPSGGPLAGEPDLPEPVEETAWERRSELGFFAGFFGTWKDTLFAPTRTFERMRVDHSRGAFLYGFLCNLVGGLVGMLWGWVQFKLQAGTNPAFSDPQLADAMEIMEAMYGGVGFILLPIMAALGIYVWAGLLHLSCLVFGAAERGFDATFRAVCYTQGVQLFNVIPGCGGLIAAVWSIVLLIIATMKLQRTTGGRAAGAVLVWIGVCCACICAVFFVAMAMGAAGSGLQ